MPREPKKRRRHENGWNAVSFPRQIQKSKGFHSDSIAFGFAKGDTVDLEANMDGPFFGYGGGRASKRLLMTYALRKIVVPEGRVIYFSMLQQIICSLNEEAPFLIFQGQSTNVSKGLSVLEWPW